MGWTISVKNIIVSSHLVHYNQKHKKVNSRIHDVNILKERKKSLR